MISRFELLSGAKKAADPQPASLRTGHLAYGSPEGAQQAEKSVLRRNPFRMIHHQNLDRIFRRLKLQPQLLL